MKRVFVLFMIGAAILSGSAFAYDNDLTHIHLTEAAIKKSGLNQYLIDNLYLLEGTGSFLGDRSIIQWIQEGSRLEDDPVCRASNHFHNPITFAWGDAQVLDIPDSFQAYCSLEDGGQYAPVYVRSALCWATNYASPTTFYSGARNTHDWDDARGDFYIVLTGRDFDGNQIWLSHTSDEKEEALQNLFVNLGYVIHVLQDMAVPAHVRSDFMSHMADSVESPISVLRCAPHHCGVRMVPLIPRNLRRLELELSTLPASYRTAGSYART